MKLGLLPLAISGFSFVFTQAKPYLHVEICTAFFNSVVRKWPLKTLQVAILLENAFSWAWKSSKTQWKNVRVNAP